jgi:hypothetical protein
MFFYESFIARLPEDAETWRQRLHELFPKLYDTKYLFQEIELKKSGQKTTVSNGSLQSIMGKVRERELAGKHKFVAKVAPGFEQYRVYDCLEEE